MAEENKDVMFTLFSSKTTGNASCRTYHERTDVIDKGSLIKAVSHDYVAAKYTGDKRSIKNFEESDCLVLDCDNETSENPDDWITKEKLISLIPDVKFAIHYSRNNNKEKNGKSARPRFHVLFPVKRITSAAEYVTEKRKVYNLFPFFDKNALDAARFFYGTENPDVDIIDGTKTITEFVSQKSLSFPKTDAKPIKVGERNSTLISTAISVLKRYGNTKEAKLEFLKKESLCEEKLDKAELRGIWNSALKFYNQNIKTDENYIKPDAFNSTVLYMPDEFTDVGEARVLSKYYKSVMRYSQFTHFLVYEGQFWRETDIANHPFLHSLSDLQIAESRMHFARMEKKIEEAGIVMLLSMYGKDAYLNMTDEQKEIYAQYVQSIRYKSFALKMQNSSAIESVLREVKSMIEIKPSELDRNPFLLNCPSGTCDIRLGIKGLREHRADDLITKMTSANPGEKGEEIWLECLNVIFQKDSELIEYVQEICGLAAIGKVFIEALIIAYGQGRNGKSTFWNAISKTLGMYSGMISADALSTNCKRNVKPEMAEAKGKRLLIAGEMQEGARLNDSFVKQMCSTDEIEAEKKYKDPFKFTPCHTLVLYTNHLPKVSGTDDGIWRRLIVIPFNAKIEGGSDIKNYADYLFENARESILKWIIEGAKRVIEKKYHIEMPECVKSAIGSYRLDNDWFAHFLEEKCKTGENLREKSSVLYKAYRDYCTQNNEYTRSTRDFYTALEKSGFKKANTHRPVWYEGLSVIEENNGFENSSYGETY